MGPLQLATMNCVKKLSIATLECVTKKHDMLLVIGDLIARVGNDNTRNQAYIGVHGTGQIDENGTSTRFL